MFELDRLKAADRLVGSSGVEDEACGGVPPP
jgi:hypothetical protein